MEKNLKISSVGSIVKDGDTVSIRVISNKGGIDRYLLRTNIEKRDSKAISMFATYLLGKPSFEEIQAHRNFKEFLKLDRVYN